MELRNTIMRGSLWFATTTLILLGIGRCHVLASSDKQLAEVAAPSQNDSGIAWNPAFDHRKHLHGKGKYPWKAYKRYPKDSGLDIEGAMRRYRENKGKSVSPKLALELLLALRQQKKNMGTTGVTGTDSLRLERELLRSVREGNHHGSRPLAWNRDDSAQWDNQPGIGPATARRIIRYRTKLGGFTHPLQLLEIPHFDTTLAEFLAPTFQFNPQEITKLNPNPNWKSLYSHPYIGPAIAKILHPFLTQHPQLTHKDWQAMKGIPPDLREKIEPYLLFID